MFRHIYTIIGVVGLVGLVACTKDIYHTSTPAGPVAATTAIPAPKAASDGASSGGGGYVTTNSKKLLELVITDLATEIKQASPFLFSDLPQSWTQQKLSEVISHIRLSSTKDVQRDNSDLLFNYGEDEKGQYIEALRPFFVVYGQIPMRFSSPDSNAYLTEIIFDLRLKLLHEVAHLLGKDEGEAEKYGLTLLKKIERDFYVCMVSREQITTAPNILWVSHVGMTWWTKGGGGSSNCFGPRPDCEPQYNFNWIHSNNWIYHQAKNQMLQSTYSVTYYSYLDPQPYEILRKLGARAMMRRA